MTDLPRGKFGCVVADPPWRFDNRASRAAAENHYATMATTDIAALPVARILKPDAHLYLWVTDGHLFEAQQVIAAWGFTFKRSLPWVKTRAPSRDLPAWPDRTASKLEWRRFAAKLWYRHETLIGPRLQMGLGNVFRGAHELCLFATRGRRVQRQRDIPTVLFAPRGRHSEKPPELLAIAERMSPGPRLELFARQASGVGVFEKWTRWGMEAA